MYAKKITITFIIMWNCFILNLTTAHADTKIKTSLLVSIIDDPYSNKQIAVIKKNDGYNISANKSV
ncbi:hypothetical protein NLU03_29925, partial [Bacillus toyonensis]|nr:hypothetical protein [Bacillus toyonensis]